MSWVGGFYAGAIVLWLLAGYLAGTHLIFFMAVVLASLQMSWQVTTLDMADAQTACAASAPTAMWGW